MKKTSILLIICLLFSSINFSWLGLLSYASDEIAADVLTPEAHNTYLEEALSESTSYSSGITTYDNFMVAYFDNLTYNIGVNYKGSCGYVAMSMLLSYYDTFLNDDIVPDQYDIASLGTDDIISRRNSPGVLRDIVINTNDTSDENLTTMSATDYYSHINSLSNISLHAKLITIGSLYGYYNFSAKDDEYPAGTLFARRYNVLTHYLSNVPQIDSNNYEISSINREYDHSQSDLVRQFTLQSIMEGNPVLLSIYGANGGHVVVAYDYEYDVTTSRYNIYCHMGWGADKTHVTIESQGFTVYRTALTINFNTEHSHSDNYGVTTITNNIPTTEYYCYDYSHIITYKDLHSYTDHYQQNTVVNHKAYCECGEYVTQSHTFVNNVCTLCGDNHEHNYSYRRLSDTTHRRWCLCGEEVIEPHVVESGAFTSGNKYAICLACGGLATVGLTIHQAIGDLPRSENGSFILPNGVIVLVDEDMEAYFNGTLEFYYPDDNLETE